MKPGSRRDAEGTQGLLPHFTLRLTGHIAQRQCVTAPAQQGPGCSGPSTARAQCCHAPRGQGRTHRSVPPVTPLPRGGLMPAPPGHPPALPDEQVSALVTAPVHAPVPRNRLQTPSWASGTTDRTETPAESQHQFLPVLSPGFMALPEIFFFPTATVSSQRFSAGSEEKLACLSHRAACHGSSQLRYHPCFITGRVNCFCLKQDNGQKSDCVEMAFS